MVNKLDEVICKKRKRGNVMIWTLVVGAILGTAVGAVTSRAEPLGWIRQRATSRVHF